MFSTPLICCSSGVTTVEATTSALAPGYWPVTLMTGGAISGYWATGSRPKETAPKITNTSDSTAAKIGRSMKKREMRMGIRCSVGRGLSAAGEGRGVVCGGRFLRGHLDAGARPHQAVDDHAVIGVEARGNDALVLDDGTERDVFRAGNIV